MITGCSQEEPVGSFRFVGCSTHCYSLQWELEQHPELWGQQTARLGVGSPHEETQDIWVRYRDLAEYAAKLGSDMTQFCSEHESVWLPPARHLPAAVAIARCFAYDDQLGGILITKLPPGKRIKRHVDTGWHAESHRKFYVAVQNLPGARFCWDDGVIAPTVGDVYEFRNDIPHWVVNDSDRDRIAMIVCVKRPGIVRDYSGAAA